MFLPVSFMEGGMGVFFKEFGLTVALAAFFSLVVARLITPMMAAFFLKNHGHEAEAKPGILTETYHDALSWSIHNPWKTIAMGMPCSSARSCWRRPCPVVIPRFDNGMIQARVEIPPGTPVLDADRAPAHERAHSGESRSHRRVHTMNGADGAGAGCEFLHPAEAAQ